MKLQWTRAACRDLTEARYYIAEDDPQAAQQLAQKILAAIDEILQFPKIGKRGRRRNTQEFAVPSTPYLIIYRIKDSKTPTIQILRVYHGRRRWPPKRR